MFIVCWLFLKNSQHTMNMKTLVVTGAAISAVVILISGCSDAVTDKSQFNQTFFPTNHWVVVGQGTNGQVVVETKSTNMLEYLRVHAATAVVPLTNGQSARVEITIRLNPLNRKVDIISSKAYPAKE